MTTTTTTTANPYTYTASRTDAFSLTYRDDEYVTSEHLEIYGMSAGLSEFSSFTAAIVDSPSFSVRAYTDHGDNGARFQHVHLGQSGHACDVSASAYDHGVNLRIRNADGLDVCVSIPGLTIADLAKAIADAADAIIADGLA